MGWSEVVVKVVGEDKITREHMREKAEARAEGGL